MILSPFQVFFRNFFSTICDTSDNLRQIAQIVPISVACHKFEKKSKQKFVCFNKMYYFCSRIVIKSKKQI